MQRVHTVLLSAILLALCFIAIELARIDRELVPGAALSQAAVTLLTAPPPTPAQEAAERTRAINEAKRIGHEQALRFKSTRAAELAK